MKQFSLDSEYGPSVIILGFFTISDMARIFMVVLCEIGLLFADSVRKYNLSFSYTMSDFMQYNAPNIHCCRCVHYSRSITDRSNCIVSSYHAL